MFAALLQMHSNFNYFFMVSLEKASSFLPSIMRKNKQTNNKTTAKKKTHTQKTPQNI